MKQRRRLRGTVSCFVIDDSEEAEQSERRRESCSAAYILHNFFFLQEMEIIQEFKAETIFTF